MALALLVPVLALAQPGLRPPPIPSPPPGAPPAGPGQAPPGGVLTAPAGMPSPETGVRHLTQEEWNTWYYRIFKIPKNTAVLLGNNRLRANRMLHTVYEIVGEDGADYLIRNLSPEDPDAAGHRNWLRQVGSEIGRRDKAEYLKGKYLIVDNPEVPPAFTDRLRFVAADAGLPKSGRWQISFDVADMNGDGLPDLVFGPQRTAEHLVPSIFFQQNDHSWRLAQAKWPTSGLKLDYGTVRVADFDGDGNKDIAIACHFSRTYVLYGNSRGDFTRFAVIPQTDPNMTARALTVADFNHDGRPDIASFAEINLNMATIQRLGSGLVNVALNLPTGWKAAAGEGIPGELMGDSLTAVDLDGDGFPDLVLTSRALNVMDLIFRNTNGGNAWQAIATAQMPVYAYVGATAAGPLDRFPRPDVVSCFEQHNPWKSDVPTQACVIYRFHDATGKPVLEPTATVLFQEKARVTTRAVAIGDIDGDGRNDIVVVTDNGRVRVFLQGADGEFLEQRNAGMDQPGTDISDVKIADLYHDGKGEIVFAGSPTKTQGGGVWVYRPEKLEKATPAKTP